MNSSSQNGHAFLVFMEEAAESLSRIRLLDYYRQPMPSADDERLETMVARFMVTKQEERERFQASLEIEQRSVLGIYGHRAATLSVREGSAARLLSGLVGAAIANYEIPEKRNVDVALAIFYHCARRLGLEPADLFDQAAYFAAGEIARRMRAFGRRDDITLQRYGWREYNTPRGVRYRFDWR
jgi:hypothetical protein